MGNVCHSCPSTAAKCSPWGLLCSVALQNNRAVIDVETIDHLNILQATLVAMEHAVQSLPRAADYVLVDGNRLPKVRCM